jgi:hypothetical protein
MYKPVSVSVLSLSCALVAHSINALAFERRCIRGCFVALLAAYRRGVCLSRAPCWHGSSTLSIRHRSYETDHLAFKTLHVCQLPESVTLSGVS